MTRSVFILGAGASREAGAPLLTGFLDTARDLARSGEVADSQEHFDRVFRAMGSLQRVHAKSQLDITNVESVFATFEMAGLLGNLGEYDRVEVSALAASMRVMIARTIEATLKFPFEGGAFSAPRPYDALAELLVALRQRGTPEERASIITFNYDLAADLALTGRYGIDYGIHTVGHDPIPLLKLHGSLNWFRCETCGVIPWHLHDFMNQLPVVFLRDRGEAPITPRLKVAEWDHVKRLGHTVSPDPFIVPPTWNKAEYHRLLAPVWARAAQELRDAENIYVIGFSLPATDEFFRFLYALGTLSDTMIHRFWVVNPDKSGVTENRFREMLWLAAQQRFEYLPVKFSEALLKIENQYKMRRP